MRIERREFLILGSLLGLTSQIHAQTPSRFEKEFKTLEPLFFAIQSHLFPEGGVLPSASSMKSTKFLYETMKHSSFDRDIQAFVLEGARELDTRTEGKFLSLTSGEKEKALREYETTRYGKSWLSRIMTLTMESMLSDPIYGSNIKKAGWKALGHTASFPQPSEKYLGLK